MQRIAASVADLQRMADASARGLIASYCSGGGFNFMPAPESRSHPAVGTQELHNLSDELLLIRTDFRAMPSEFRQHNRYDYDNRGWLYLHCRLDGLSEERTPDGQTHCFDGECFMLSASTRPAPLARDVLGDSWRTVGIACRPAFVMRDVPIGGTLPAQLKRFQSGDVDVDFFFEGRLTSEMKAAVTALLYPSVQATIRPLYLKAKVVELLCLAMDRLQVPSAQESLALRLSHRDVACLNTCRQLLQDCVELPSLEQLARRVGLNRRKLAVGFKQVFGVTVGTYHRERRLDAARELLQRGAVSIGRVAADAGYADAGSFSKAFRTRFGYLPSEMRPAKVTGARK
ncbi:MAG: helix-turn-helix transcriptional regulator [Proteobacteria bacterium]|nr:helix-turn-helix transcriptional regulator [Pseudomonadota bacterium]